MSDEPYLVKEVVRTARLFNPEYGNDRVCMCGHTYERHFDFYEEPDMQDVGCKYCPCDNFMENTNGQQE